MGGPGNPRTLWGPRTKYKLILLPPIFPRPGHGGHSTSSRYEIAKKVHSSNKGYLPSDIKHDKRRAKPCQTSMGTPETPRGEGAGSAGIFHPIRGWGAFVASTCSRQSIQFNLCNEGKMGLPSYSKLALHAHYIDSVSNFPRPQHSWYLPTSSCVATSSSRNSESRMSGLGWLSL